MFAQLQSQSHFSFLQGASSPQELVCEAHRLGYHAIAITDECSLAGIVKAHSEAQQLNMQLIVGSQFQVDDGLDSCHLVLLATCRQAYSEISLLISKARRRSNKGEYQVNFMDLQFGTRHCLAIWLPQTAQNKEHSDYQKQQLQQLKRYFKQRLWLGVDLLRNGLDDQHYQYCYQLAQQYDVSMVACPSVVMHQRQRQPLQDTVTAIRHNCTLAELGQRRLSNSESFLRPLDNLEHLYPEELLLETLQLAELCRFSLTELRHDYPEELVPETLSATQHLHNLTYQGAHQRWPQGVPEAMQRQLEFELTTIAELRYEHYFLTVEDIVRFARSQNILCQGRGSAANSIVCYCLHITAVNPQHSSLLFERFISKERNEPPDIDVDFEHERREEVIQYIYQKYTRK
ncbi:MAG: PHP domain-containing protein, partial [Pseudomonadota bacterium]|nr:PHP domain-containing protein [Pseudomonadota bacterium]